MGCLYLSELSHQWAGGGGVWKREEGQMRGVLFRAVGHGRKALWPKLHWSRFLLEAGRNDINQLALKAIVPEFLESPRAWGVCEWEKRESGRNIRELTEEPGLEVKIVVAFLGPQLPLPRGTDNQWGGQETGAR